MVCHSSTSMTTIDVVIKVDDNTTEGADKEDKSAIYGVPCANPLGSAKPDRPSS